MLGQPGRGPVVRRILLGSQLRRLRESKGISREDAGYSIRASESKISRLELGRVSFKERDVADLLTLYGVTAEADRAPLLSLLREANKPGWWQSLTDVLPSWFEPYLGLEAAATLIRVYEVQFIPGLLQTEEYARTVITKGNGGASTENIERRVGVRMSRQKILSRHDPPRLWVVVDEAALRRQIGGHKVMRAQLEQLIALAEQPSLVIQVMPLAFGGHVAEGGAFSILRFPESDLPDIVYLEHLTGAAYLDRQEDVDRHWETMNRLSLESAQPARSTEIVSDIIAEM